MKLENFNDKVIITCALRYCLGRKTYVVNSFVDVLKGVWEQLHDGDRGVIVVDILKAFEEGNVGSDSEARQWRELVRWCYKSLGDEAKSFVAKSLIHREDALDALNYDEIGTIAYLKAHCVEDIKPIRKFGVIVARSDAHGLCYRLVSHLDNLDKEWFDAEELELTQP